MQQSQQSDETNQGALREFIKAELAEMEKFRWRLGKKIGHDPLNDRSLNEIYGEWIIKYSEAFKNWWTNNKSNCSFTMHFKIHQMTGK